MRSGESIRTILAKINAPNSQNQLFLCAGPHHQWKNQQYFAMCPHPKHIQEALQRLADLLPYAVWKCGASVKKLFLPAWDTLLTREHLREGEGVSPHHLPFFASQTIMNSSVGCAVAWGKLTQNLVEGGKIPPVTEEILPG